MSHSIHLKPRPPTRGLSLRAARHTTGRSTEGAPGVLFIGGAQGVQKIMDYSKSNL